MPKVFEEEFLRFEFADDWHVIKYDEHRDYVSPIRHSRGTKAVDFAAIYQARTLFLIEVKGIRGHRIESWHRITDGKLAKEVAQKWIRKRSSGPVTARLGNVVRIWLNHWSRVWEWHPRTVSVIISLCNVMPPEAARP